MSSKAITRCAAGCAERPTGNRPPARHRRCGSLGNGNQVVISQARINSDALFATARAQPVQIATTDDGMVTRRRTDVSRSIGLGYVVVAAAAEVACVASDCLGHSLDVWH